MKAKTIFTTSITVLLAALATSLQVSLFLSGNISRQEIARKCACLQKMKK